MEFKSYQEIYNEVNSVSQFQGLTDKIVNEAVKELDIIKKTYKEEYQGAEIKRVLAKAEKKMSEARNKFLQLLQSELNKNAEKIPNNLDVKNYSDKDIKLLEYEIMAMSNEELLQFAQDNPTDRVVHIMSKGTLIQRANNMNVEGNEDLAVQKQNLIQSAKLLKLETKESIIAEQLASFNSINPNQLYVGESFGRTLSINEQGGLEGVICSKANIDKVKHIEHKNDNRSNFINGFQNTEQFK